MDHSVLQALVPSINTPRYVFDLDRFHSRVREVKDAFGEKTRLCFSIKANPFLLDFLPSQLECIEVCSPGELTVCEALGVDMSRVIFSGVNKTREDAARAMADGVGVFTAESLLHMRYIEECAAEECKTVPVLLRLTAGSQFGMSEEDVFTILRSNYPHTRVVGLHYFSGTQKRKSSAICKELDYLMDFVGRVREELGVSLERLEYGTGLAVDYFTANPEESEHRRLEEVSEKIREVSQKIELTVEMGRFFSAPCGYYFTKIMDTKHSHGVNYAIVDGGSHQLKYDGQIQGMQIPRITHLKGPHRGQPSEEQPWTLCGSLCTTADVLARNAPFQDLAPEDVLVFAHTGAYSVTEGISLFLSRDLPEVAVWSQAEGLQLLRCRVQTAQYQLCDRLAGRVLP